jgi:hypothetical protein
MDRDKFAQGFARRIAKVMDENGFGKDKFKSGVDIHALSKASGCSYQMARKYALGDVLPEPHIILKIAEWLNISPNWLLFGDQPSTTTTKQLKDNVVEIDQGLLRHILDKCSVFLTSSNYKKSALDFVMGIIDDASKLNADNETILKVIDMMVTSATLVKNDSHRDLIKNNNSATNET